jgi:predicted AAA+ superfamily ATPase
MEKLESFLEESTFVVMSSPPASGKTSLVQIFMHHCPHKCIYLGFNSDEDPYNILSAHGINLRTSTFTLSTKSPTYIFIDDAQKKFRNLHFGPL